MTSFFYVVSIALHTSVPVLRKCMNTSRKKYLFTESAATHAPGQGESVIELMPFMNFLVHSYTCCSDRHASPYVTFIHQWILMGFTPSLLKKRLTALFFFGACCKRDHHLYTTTVLSCCIPALYCHLSGNLQIMSIVVVNLQDNQAVFRIFIALLRFSFDSPSYFIYFTIFILINCIHLMSHAGALMWVSCGVVW